MTGSLEMKQCMIPVASTATIETVKTDIETIRLILKSISPGHGKQKRVGVLTIESKHCVQSSRYTDWLGLGGCNSAINGLELCLTGRVRSYLHSPAAVV